MLLLQSIDVYCPPGAQQQTCRGGFAAVRPGCHMLGH